ncbi:hypothetical protein Nepgr_001055 [Nepenthes gracilis]|uniref:Uncharacterized protein n=1 Tax=Nepenthes gracilis TaxID=150966 RepID=A0AAD3P3S1_NEPGR|nr:hypothetical protein Nepgr_001055 [Nepenthes gracilis]
MGLGRKDICWTQICLPFGGRCPFRWLWNQLGPVLLVLLSDASIAGLGVWSVAVGFCFFVLMVESQPGIDDWTAAIGDMLLSPV